MIAATQLGDGYRRQLSIRKIDSRLPEGLLVRHRGRSRVIHCLRSVVARALGESLERRGSAKPGGSVYACDFCGD